MGINYSNARFLASCCFGNDPPIEKVDFSKTITLGRQALFMSQGDLDRLASSICNKLTDDKHQHVRNNLGKAGFNPSKGYGYAEPFLKVLAYAKGG